jgi:hypothetical protein
MRTFFVALATGGALAVALPAVTALTTAVADDWIATDRPVQLTQKPDDGQRAEGKTRRAAKKTEGGVLAQPSPIRVQALGNIQLTREQEPAISQPAR